MKQVSLICALVLSTISMTFAQGLKLPALSPTAKISQSFSVSEIEIAYSRPSLRGRKAFGQLVAYGELWRTGANAATKVTFGEDVVLGGTDVKAGSYALYTVPGEKSWEIILNKGVNNWGTGGYNKEDDVVRFNVTPKKINNKIETFTITISDITYTTCNIVLKWENTKVVVPVKANNEERIQKDITKAVENPSIPYYQAANYYLQTGQNLKDALKYADKAIEENPKAFWIQHLKAKIAKEMGEKAIAIDAANKAMELSKGSAYEAEQKRNNELIINSFK
ncbi:MAG: DUF2911 domain-containing protein [Flavipsychrobacter sp.]